jgi:hypothetical protein
MLPTLPRLVTQNYGLSTCSLAMNLSIVDVSRLVMSVTTLHISNR